MITQQPERKRRGHPAGHKDETKQRMQDIIDFIGSYAKQHKVAPTLKEIALGVGMNETDSGNVSVFINTLITEGFLTRVGRHQGRSIAVASKPPRKRYYIPPKTS